jgi:hypothetical protein
MPEALPQEERTDRFLTCYTPKLPSENALTRFEDILGYVLTFKGKTKYYANLTDFDCIVPVFVLPQRERKSLKNYRNQIKREICYKCDRQKCHKTTETVTPPRKAQRQTEYLDTSGELFYIKTTILNEDSTPKMIPEKTRTRIEPCRVLKVKEAYTRAIKVAID